VVVVSVAGEAVSVAVPVGPEVVSVAPEAVLVVVGSCAEALAHKTAKTAPSAARMAASRRHLERRSGRWLSASDRNYLSTCV
jgi:hypothetical protein